MITHPLPEDEQPVFFDWYENRCEQRLRAVYRGDNSQRQTLVDIAHSLRESHTYWRLVSSFTDAFDAARKESSAAEGQVLLAFAARLYAAGGGMIEESWVEIA